MACRCLASYTIEAFDSSAITGRLIGSENLAIRSGEQVDDMIHHASSGMFYRDSMPVVGPKHG